MKRRAALAALATPFLPALPAPPIVWKMVWSDLEDGRSVLREYDRAGRLLRCEVFPPEPPRQ